jgi:hypothetical protein
MSVRNCHISCNIWVKFGTESLHVMPFIVCELHENLHSEGDTLCEKVDEILLHLHVFFPLVYHLMGTALTKIWGTEFRKS